MPRTAIDPLARVGVVAGPSDDTLDWLRRIGIAAEPVTDAALAAGSFGEFTTVLVGIFGFGQRPALRRHRDGLVAWVEGGGSLVTLYHRPGDGWDEGRTPPRRIVIGSPSFRWRVTEPDAGVKVLVPDHLLLGAPNRIGEAEWQGWVRERGLYFAADWDSATCPCSRCRMPASRRCAARCWRRRSAPGATCMSRSRCTTSFPLASPARFGCWRTWWLRPARQSRQRACATAADTTSPLNACSGRPRGGDSGTGRSVRHAA